MRNVVRKLPVALVGLAMLISLMAFVRLDVYTSIAVVSLLLVWILFFLKYGSIIASLLFLLIVFPLNIAYVIPQFVDGAYVVGTYVNYLAPTLTILDFAVALLFLSLVVNMEPSDVTKRVRWLLIGIVVVFLIHNLLFLELTVFATSLRYLVYTLTALLFYVNRTTILKLIDRRARLYIITLVIVLVAQLILMILQIDRGASVGISFLGESQVSAGGVYSSSIDIGRRLLLRGYGTFPHPNVLSGFASLVIIVTLSLWVLFKKLKAIEALAVLVPAYSLVVLSFSHTAYLLNGLVFVVLVASLLFKWYKRNGNETATFIAFIGLIKPDDSSISERLDLMKSSWNYLGDYIFKGVGAGNFVRYFYQYSPRSDSGISLMQPVHNIHMLFLVEYGLFLGGILNIFILAYFIIRFIKSNSKVFILLLFIFILTVGNLDHYFLTLPQGFLLFISAFLLALLSD